MFSIFIYNRTELQTITESNSYINRKCPKPPYKNHIKKRTFIKFKKPWLNAPEQNLDNLVIILFKLGWLERNYSEKRNGTLKGDTLDIHSIFITNFYDICSFGETQTHSAGNTAIQRHSDVISLSENSSKQGELKKVLFLFNFFWLLL